MNYAETQPYSYKLRAAVDNRLTAVSYTEKEVLDSIMELAVQRETENNFNSQITKDIYFTVLYDIISNVLFKKRVNK